MDRSAVLTDSSSRCFLLTPVLMLVRLSLVNVRFAERTTTKNKKSLDTGGRAPRDFSNRTVRKGVSFWNVFGVPSRAVRQVLGGRTAVFEKSCNPRRVSSGRKIGTIAPSRRNCLFTQPFTSQRCPKKNRLHPTDSRHGARHRYFAVPRKRSTPRTEKLSSTRISRLEMP